LRPVIGVDADEFARRQIERLHQKAGDTTQILHLVTTLGGLASDNLHRLVGLGNSDDIEDRTGIAVMYGFSDEPRIRQVEKRRLSGLAQAAAPDVQGSAPS